MEDKKIFIKVDGKEHEVPLSHFEEDGGASAYAKAYKDATIRMKDNDGDYDVPLSEYEKAINGGLHPFTMLRTANPSNIPAQSPSNSQILQGNQGSMPESLYFGGKTFKKEDLLKSPDPIAPQSSVQVEKPKAQPTKKIDQGKMYKEIEEQGLDGSFKPKPVKSYDDARENIFNRFALTQEGIEANNEISDAEKGIRDMLSNEMYSTPAYKQIMSSSAIQADKDKAIQALWNDKYQTKLEKSMQPYYNSYNEKVIGRYGDTLKKDMQSLDNKNIANSWNSIETRIAQQEKGIDSHRGKAYLASSLNDQINTKTDNSANRTKARQIEAAKSLMEGARNIMNAADEEKDGTFIGSVLRGTRDQAFNLDNWTMGLKGLSDGVEIQRVLEKYEKGGKLDESERVLMDAVVSNAATEAFFRSKLGRGYKAGEVTGASLPFMVDMLTGVAAVSSATKLASKGLLKYIAKNYAKNTIQKNITKGVVGLTKGITDTAIHTASFGASRVGSDYINRGNGEVRFDMSEKGPEYAGREGMETGAKALAKAAISTGLETQSELVGAQFAPALGFVGKTIMRLPGLKKVPASDFGKYIKEVASAPSMQTFREFARKAQFQGPVAEYAEEIYNNIGSTAIGDMTPEQLTDLDQNIDTFLGVGVMSSAFGLAGTGAFIRDRYKTGKEIRSFEDKMRDVIDFDKLKPDLAKLDIEGARKFVKETMADNDLTPEEKKEEIKYIANVLKESAMNKTEDMPVPDEEIESNKAQIFSAFHSASSKFEELSPEEQSSVLNNNLDELDDDKKDIAVDFLAARKDFENYSGLVNRKVESAKEEARTGVEGLINPQVNGIVSVYSKISPTPISIVGGKVEFNEDGTINKDKSDSVLFYLDENGNKQMTSPEQIFNLVDMRDANAVMDEMETQAENEVRTAEEAALPIPQVGKEVTIGGEQGVISRLEGDGAVVSFNDRDELVSLNDLLPKDNIEESSNVSEIQLENESVPQVEQSTLSEQPAVVENTQEETQSDVEPTIPMDDKGEPIYHKAPIDLTIDDLNDGTLTPDEVDSFASANWEQARKDYDKITSNPPKMGTSKTKYIADKAKWAESQKEAEEKMDYWKEIQNELKSQREQIGDRTAQTALDIVEPVNEEELAADFLTRVKLLRDSYTKELGHGNGEARGMFGMFASKAKGGISIEKAGELLEVLDKEEGHNFFKEGDINAGRNAIISVLAKVKTRKDLNRYIQDIREAQAEKESRAEREYYENMIQSNYHMSIEDYEASEEQAIPTIESKYKDINIDELNNDFAEQFNNYEYGQGTSETGNEGSNTVLPGEEVIQGTGIESSEGDQQLQPVSIESSTQDGVVQEDPQTVDNSDTVIDEAQQTLDNIDSERQVVNTAPTEAQKEAGNYKMGHIKVDGFDITIENPKDSVRSGTDKNGKKWETNMQNDYGYIRGTQSVDGDHIDVFLSPFPTQGNVFVVDQVNTDGSFDEHKVMYGFSNVEEAKAAYLSNYSKGWKGLGNITEVSKEEFKKWIDSSKRKTKPFAEYSSVKAKIDNDEIINKIKGTKDKDIIKEDEKRRMIYTEYRKEHGDISDDLKRIRKEYNDYYIKEYESSKKKYSDIIDNDIAKQASDLSDDLLIKQEYFEKQMVTDINEIVDREISNYLSGDYDKPSLDKPLVKTIISDIADSKARYERTKPFVKSEIKKRALSEDNNLSKSESTKDKTVPNKKTSSTTPTATKIEDVGEKLGGAKKDLIKEYRRKAEEIKDNASFLDDIAKLPLSKIYNFNYKSLRNEGVSNEVITMVDCIKKVIPSKPRTAGWKLKDYTSKVFQLYTFALKIISDESIQDEYIEKMNTVRGLNELYTAAMAVGGYDGCINTGDVTLKQLGDTTGFYNKEGEFVSTKGQWFVKHAGLSSGLYKTYEEAKEAIMKFAGATSDKGEKNVKFSIYSYRDTGKSFITLSGKPSIIIESGFDTSKEARKYLNENYDALVDKYKSLSSVKVGFKDSMPRQGKDWRNGKDVTAEEFKEAFGFRGVEFGNWAKQDERQMALNNAYDSFMDLAVIVGKNPLSLSLNGELGIGFGSRGSGNASAHYEAEKIVINLTKTKGVGSLAHEWWHALDNYFSRRRGNKHGFNTNKDGYSITRDNGKIVRRADNERGEITDAFDSLMRVINNSEYGKRSSYYASLHSDYWKKPTELGARAFEMWVGRKLSESNTVNSFLSPDPDVENIGETFAENAYPYPIDSDFDTLEPAFDDLFEIIKEKTEEGKSVMFDKGNTGSISEADKVTRDALVKVLNDMGIYTSLDEEEGQRVLNMSTNARTQSVYHGSNKSFYYFDSSFMGEGEGAQAHGWGHYVAVDNKTARAYSVNVGKEINHAYELFDYDNNSIEYINEKVSEELYDEIVEKFGDIINDYSYNVGEGGIAHFKDNIPDEKRIGVEQYAQDLYDSVEWVQDHFDNLISKKNLYTVEIPDDNGSNYLEEDNIYEEDEVMEIVNKLSSIQDENFDFDYFSEKLEQYLETYNADGGIIYKLLSKFGFNNDSEKASKALHSIGYTGIKYDGVRDGECYVIFNDDDLKIIDHVKFFKGENSEILGFTVDGKIYLDPRYAKPETPLHEYTHLWTSMIRKTNPDAWNDISKLMKGETELWDYVSKMYPELKDDDLIDEVLAHYSGKRGAERIKQEQEKIAKYENISVEDMINSMSALEKIKAALKKFWSSVGDLLHIRFNKADEVADRVLADFLNGFNPTNDENKSEDKLPEPKFNKPDSGKWKINNRNYSKTFTDKKLLASGMNPLYEWLEEIEHRFDSNYRDTNPTPTLQDYFKDTSTKFEAVASPNLIDDEVKKQLIEAVENASSFKDIEAVKENIWVAKAEEVKKLWQDMKDSGRYDWHKSPLSNSEYLIDVESGDIYRYSNHWNTVASCEWILVDKNGNEFDQYTIAIGKSNIADFEGISKTSRNSEIQEETKNKYFDLLKQTIANYKSIIEGNDLFEVSDAAKKLMQDKLTGYEDMLNKGVMKERISFSKGRSQDLTPIDGEDDSDTSQNDYNKAVEDTKFRAQEAYQDSMLALKKLQEVIEKQSGKKIESFEDAYKAENRMSSKSTRNKEVFYDKYYKPMEQEITNMYKAFDYDSIILYVVCKHGLERNEVLARRDGNEKAQIIFNKKKDALDKELENKKISKEDYDAAIVELENERADNAEEFYKKNRDTDYSGLSSIFDGQTLEDYEKGAKSFVSSVEDDYDTTALWDSINKATKATLMKSYNSGLMSKETYEKVSKMFNYYVPLRGWKEEVASDVYEYMNSKVSPVSPVLKGAKGRKSIADDPFAVIGNMAESTILQGNRNLMKQAFYSMVINHPTKVATVRNTWYVYNLGSEMWERNMPTINETDSPQVIEEKFREHEAHMKELEESGLATRKANDLNINYRATDNQKSEHIVIVMRGGKEQMITVNGNPRAAQAINGMTNPEVDNNKFIQALGSVNRFMAANFTTRNPAFVLSNLSRDLIFAQTAVSTKESTEYSAKFMTNIPKAMKIIAKGLKGEPEGYFKEFLDNGGETGYMNLTDIDAYKKKIKADIAHLDGSENKAKTALKYAVDRLEDFNRWAEDVSRFTAYMTSRQMGRSIADSINDAKEITVNFNKKGAGLKSYNTHKAFYAKENLLVLSAGMMKMFYLFFNAGIQSLVNFGRIAKKHPVAFSSAIGGFIAAGTLMPLVNSVLYSMMGGGDDDPYDDLPDWVRRNNLCIYCGGGKFITIPLPIELRAFYGLGDIIYGAASNNEIDAKELSYNIINQFTELLPLNPIGNNGDISSSFMPDAAKPFWQIYQNTDFTGKPIYKATAFNELDPEFKRVYKGTSGWLVDTSKFFNNITGGNDFKKGLVDINPAKIEHLYETYFGGVGKTLNQLGKTIYYGSKSIAEGEVDEDLKLRNVPIVNRFLSIADERSAFSGINKAYQKLVDEYEVTKHELDGLNSKAAMMVPEYQYQFAELAQSERGKRKYDFEFFKESIDNLYKLAKELPESDRGEVEKEIIELKRNAVEQMKSTNSANESR